MSSKFQNVKLQQKINNELFLILEKQIKIHLKRYEKEIKKLRLLLIIKKTKNNSNQVLQGYLILTEFRLFCLTIEQLHGNQEENKITENFSFQFSDIESIQYNISESENQKIFAVQILPKQQYINSNVLKIRTFRLLSEDDQKELKCYFQIVKFLSKANGINLVKYRLLLESSVIRSSYQDLVMQEKIISEDDFWSHEKWINDFNKITNQLYQKLGKKSTNIINTYMLSGALEQSGAENDMKQKIQNILKKVEMETKLQILKRENLLFQNYEYFVVQQREKTEEEFWDKFIEWQLRNNTIEVGKIAPLYIPAHDKQNTEHFQQMKETELKAAADFFGNNTFSFKQDQFDTYYQISQQQIMDALSLLSSKYISDYHLQSRQHQQYMDEMKNYFDQIKKKEYIINNINFRSVRVLEQNNPNICKEYIQAIILNNNCNQQQPQQKLLFCQQQQFEKLNLQYNNIKLSEKDAQEANQNLIKKSNFFQQQQIKIKSHLMYSNTRDQIIINNLIFFSQEASQNSFVDQLKEVQKLEQDDYKIYKQDLLQCHIKSNYLVMAAYKIKFQKMQTNKKNQKLKTIIKMLEDQNKQIKISFEQLRKKSAESQQLFLNNNKQLQNYQKKPTQELSQTQQKEFDLLKKELKQIKQFFITLEAKYPFNFIEYNLKKFQQQQL